MIKRQLGILLLIFCSGCAGLVTQEEKARLEKEMTPVPVAAAPVAETDEGEATTAPAAGENAVADDEPLTRYSELNNMAPPADRQYKRMTRQRMEDESELNSSAGSLWKMEGQTAYLFAENKHRQTGDPTAIKLEGPALKQLETKVAVIQDLLNELEEQRVKSEEDSKQAAEEKLRLAQYEEEQKFKAELAEKGELVIDPLIEAEFAALEAKQLADSRKPASAATSKTAARPVDKTKEDKIDLKDIELIPSKIIEKVAGDTYRIRGQQFLTIKKKPYKVIATALVRADDFNDSGVSSNKLLDAQYDVIHVKRTAE